MINGYILGATYISGVYNGRPFNVSSENPQFKKLVEVCTSGRWEEFDAVYSLATAVVKYTQGKVTVEGNFVYYNGELLHNVVVDKILEFMEKGYPYKALLNFLEKLMQNPSKRAVTELYTFLAHKGFPIHDDGDFLAYKGLRDDYYDRHSGKFLNSIGSKHKMDRNLVDDNWGVNCSQGFHVGTYAFANDFRNGGKLVLVKINPADVVSVPSDAECQKCRVCAYEVVEDCSEIVEAPYLAQEIEYEDYEEPELLDTIEEIEQELIDDSSDDSSSSW